MTQLHNRFNIALILFLIILVFPSVSMAATATLTWEPGSPETVAPTGYKVYYGTASGNLPNVIDVGNVLTYTVTGLPDGTPHHFAVTAYSSEGDESNYSNEEMKIGATFSGDTATFTWSDIGASLYHINVGSSPGAYDYFYTYGYTTNTSVTGNGMPTDGSTVYVRFWTQIRGAWSYNDFSFTAATGGGGTPTTAIISSPADGSTLSGSSETFTWDSIAGATLYHLNIGSAPGGYDYFYTYGYTTNTSAAATGIPTDGSTVYVRLWTNIRGSWTFNDYSYTAASSVTRASISAPASGSTLSGSSETFTWNAVAGATLYYLNVGSSAGASDYFQENTASTSSAATGIPTDGSTVHVRLGTQIGGSWNYNDYSYTAASAVSKAIISAPVNGSTLSGSSETFTWNAVAGATLYHLNVGSSPGGYDHFYTYGYTTNTSATATGLPTDGSTVYVRLWTNIGGSWSSNDYSYTAATGGAPEPGAITSPADGSTLSGSSETFTWNAAAGATLYHLNVGSSVGGYDYFYTYGYTTNTSATATGLPTDGSTVYVRLWTQVGGSWSFKDYSYTAF